MFSHLSKHEAVIGIFSVAYLVIFSTIFLRTLNYEFLAYVGVLVLLFALVFFTLKQSQFPPYILWGLSIWGLLHVAGGSVPVGDTVLYGWRIVPLFDGGADFFILKMDQVIHAYGFGVAALVLHHLIRLRLVMQGHALFVGVLAALGGMGLGVVNEIIEFLAFVLLEETGVGDIYNLSLDLVFNTIGAVGAVLLLRILGRL